MKHLLKDGEKIKNNAFTLVELIVVITILSILGTIAFLSLQGYSKNSRDSVRINDIKALELGLDLYLLKAGQYPTPYNGTVITYSGSKVWTQGLLGSGTMIHKLNLNKVVVDPSSFKEYTYSLLNSNLKYSLASIFEGNRNISLNLNTNLNTYANKIDVSLFVKGNYKCNLAKVTNGNNTYIIALPSILSSTGNTLEYIAQNNNFLYNTFHNLPQTYNSSQYRVNGENNLNLLAYSNPLLYSGDINLLYGEDNTQRINLLSKLKNIYSGSKLNDRGIFKKVKELDFGNTDSVIKFGKQLVNNCLDGTIKINNSNTGSTLNLTQLNITFTKANGATYTCDSCD